ncbi:NAD(P)/FAD-dependent oxidoreductase [Lignipirellula cremea]|uniref:Putative L-tryptophan oxidase VioA n=1 Tax=Lignipirellula cremea TaxID=2528010 RepID=A0A518E591_9BACT|nr:FAD-dependent oxidoreductase [Lignipirellula cremea]QDU99250.1 putative L-tryptophan oxidase VioA [Lignipirellula cremea]
MTGQEIESVAVIGAGMAGLCCAQHLRAAGLTVRVFDKSRGVGGRLATRRTDGEAAFDHGAQYFTVSDPILRRHVDSWIRAGVAAPWSGRIVVLKQGQTSPPHGEVTRYVGAPAMTAIAKHLAHGLNLELNARIARLEPAGEKWRLRGEQEQDLGQFDAVLVTAPAPQTLDLLQGLAPFDAQLAEARLAPSWAVMLALPEPLALPLDGAFVEDSPLSWIARNSSKPERPATPDCWVLHARGDWSEEHLEEAPETVIAALLAAFWSATGATAPPDLTATAHRWRYALPTNPLPERCLFDPQSRLGVAGDWCGGPKVEGAFLSGLALAEAVFSLL